MPEKFDPYYKWLGIPPKDQPPNHYRLLAIEPFEPDSEVIDAAANRLMAYLQELTSGPHIDAAQQLLNEIAAARVCLLSGQRKSAYDAELRRNHADGANPLARSNATAVSTAKSTPHAKRLAAVQSELDSDFDSLDDSTVTVVRRLGSIRSSRSTGFGRMSQRQVLMVVLAVVAVAAIGLAFLVIVDQLRFRSSRTADRVTQTIANDEKPQPDALALNTRPPPPASIESGASDESPPDEPEDIAPDPTRADGDKLAESVQALENGNPEQALGLLKQYILNPASPQPERARKLLEQLERVLSSEKLIMEILKVRSDAELDDLDQGISRIVVMEEGFSLDPALESILAQMVRRNVAAERRRRNLPSTDQTGSAE